MISGLVLISEPEKLCYPYIESLKSFLSVCDEIVVTFNIYGKPRDDGSREKIEALGKKIRIIPTDFNLEKYGWIIYGLSRTCGYHACKGDLVLKFDADGILHEKDIDFLKNELNKFRKEGWATGYWRKNRIYKADLYYDQYKHSGIYNKAILGDRMDWMRDSGKGAPNNKWLKKSEQRSKQLQTKLFGYEHVWDTEEVLKYKVNRYGRMIDKHDRKPLQSPESYFKAYIEALVDRLHREGKTMALETHPAIIQDKLKSLTETHFGHSLFGYLK